MIHGKFRRAIAMPNAQMCDIVRQATASQDCYAGAQPQGHPRIRLWAGLRSPYLSSVNVLRNKDGHHADQSGALRRSLCLEVRNQMFRDVGV
jgi:hypothetical protein